MSANRRLFRLSATLALVAGLSVSTSVQAEQTDPAVTTHRGGVYGRLVAIKQDREAAKSAFRSSAIPVEGDSSATPTGTMPGRVSMYNVGTGTYNGLVRIVTRKSAGVKRATRQDWEVQVDVGDPLHFNLTYWDAEYRFSLWEDRNGNGVIDHRDRRKRSMRINTSRSWAWRHAWTTRQRDVVVAGVGDGGGGGNNNPPPVTNYPKGAIVSINGRQSAVLTRIDYTVGSTTLAYAYPNVSHHNWAYEAFPAWYTSPATQVTEKVTWGDAVTETKTVSAPMSATADATVTTFAGP